MEKENYIIQMEILYKKVIRLMIYLLKFKYMSSKFNIPIKIISASIQNLKNPDTKFIWQI